MEKLKKELQEVRKRERKEKVSLLVLTIKDKTAINPGEKREHGHLRTLK